MVQCLFCLNQIDLRVGRIKENMEKWQYQLPNGHQFESPQGHWRFTRSLTSGPREISRGVHKLTWTSTVIKKKKKKRNVNINCLLPLAFNLLMSAGLISPWELSGLGTRLVLINLRRQTFASNLIPIFGHSIPQAKIYIPNNEFQHGYFTHIHATMK